jgi:hypothetical protein
LESDIKTQLSLLPSDLQATYVQIFRKINNQPATSRRLAERCFLWAFHAEYLLSIDQFTDAVGLINDHEKIKYDSSELAAVTKKLIRVGGFGMQRVRPIHFSLREFVVDSQLELPLQLRSMIPDNETANARLAIECLRHILADMPNNGWLGNILLYCASYFDTHIRRLTTIPEEILQMLDRILLTEKHRLLQVLTWRWPIPIGDPLVEDDPGFTCIGNPQSIDPRIFLRCTKLDQVPIIRARYATIERIEAYPDNYLHIATITGLEDVVSELIEQGVDPNREDAGHFTALQALCDDRFEVSEAIVMMLLEAGGDPEKATESEVSPYERAKELKMEKYVQIMDKFNDVKKG